MKKKKVVRVCGVVMCAAMMFSGCGSAATDAKGQKSEQTEVVAQESEQTDASVSETAEVKKDEKTAVAAQEETASGSYETVTIQNYNLETTYEQKPEKIVTLSLNSAEIVAALGAADSIVAVQTNNNLLTDVLPEYYEMLKDVNVPEELNNGMPPTLEAMLSQEPDLVSMNSYYFYVPTFGTVEDYQANNVNLYITEGSYVEACTIENTYNDIRNLGTILGASEKAEELITDMQTRIASVEAAVSAEEKVKVMAFDSMSDNLFTIAGGSGLENSLLNMAGVENVFADVESDFSTVSMEKIIERNPEVIIIHNYTTEENNAQSKIDYLLSQEELSGVAAIQNESFIIVNLFQVNPGIQNVDFVEAVAEYTHPEAFK